jgi:hypothetical protein
MSATSAMKSDPCLLAPLDLGSKGLRLVELQPCEPSGVITCRLRSYALDSTAPPYVTLSYRWGLKNQNEEISLNGVQFHC